MIKKAISIIFLLYLLAMLQASFFVHFFDYIPNLILIVIILVNLFEKQENYFGVFTALIGGFYLDVFSGRFFGLYLLLSFFISFFIKLVVKDYI
jgi:rod shape-determining protein MreD